MSRLFFVSLFVLSSALEEYSYLGSCNDNSIPFKLEVNSRGRPELFCTRPICFGEQEKTLSTISCSRVFQKNICNEPNEWTGGLMEVSNGTENSLKSKCCSFDSELEQIQAVKTVTLGTDEKFSGGLFLSRKGIEGFDMIKEVRRSAKNNRVEYEIMIIRVPCKVDVSEEYDLLKKLGYLEDKEDNLVSDYYNDYEPVNYQQPIRQPLLNNLENYPQQSLPLQVPQQPLFSQPQVTVPPPTLVSPILTTLVPVKIVPRTIVDVTTSTATTLGTTTAETTVQTTIKSSTTIKYLRPKRLQFTQQKKKMSKKTRKSDHNDASTKETTRLEELRV